ncbi:FG-GAP-like repeat-containing protein [Streptomyces sp. NPDC051320]|uniref:FG-GAP-like repeat-containing protein n=1 Tax=Streptomyces sp. NPDC051320 TaxID=3154644 RepID=UPI003424CE28
MSVDNLDPAVLRSFVASQQTCGSLSADIQCMLDNVSEAPADDVSTMETGMGEWPGFSDGTFSISSTGSGTAASDTLTIDIPSADVQTNTPGWLITVYAALSGQLAGYIAGSLCMAAMAPGLALAATVCGAVYSFVATFTWIIVAAQFTNTSIGTGQQLANAFAGAMIATLGGTLWGKVLGPWASANLRSVMGTIANAVSRTVAAAATWLGSTTAAAATAAASVLTSIGGSIWNALTAAAEAAGLASLTSPNTLRVLPFGDSITYGYQSSDGSGYRCDLQDFLATQGDTYSFVGSQSAGSNCSQTKNEGHSGWTISQLAAIEGCTIAGDMPNVVLLDIGTNDINNGGSASSAADAIESLINKIATDDPSAVVLVSSLIPTSNSTVAAGMRSFNQQVSSWVGQQKSNGKHMDWVDQGAVRTTDLADGLHPNDTGYRKMAVAWNMGIDSALVDGWIKSPAAGGSSGCTGGAPVWLPQGEIASGPGTSTTSYPGSLSLGTGDRIVYADINSDDRADYLDVASNGSVTAWVNGGSGSSGAVSWQAHGASGPDLGSGMVPQFADVTGDGNADELAVSSSTGAVTLFRNDGTDSSGHYKWDSQGQIASGVGSPGSQIRFADINGDGRADYLNVDPDSSVAAWINGGTDSNGKYIWVSHGVVASGVGVDGSEIRFADLDGDGKADYLVLGSNGSITAFLNPGLSNLHNGGGWVPQGDIASGVGDPGSHIQLADVDGDHKADYLDVNPTNGHTKEWRNGGAISGGGWNWNSLGAIATGNSSQIKFADLNGDGKAEYIDVQDDGGIKYWYNNGADSSAPNGWAWTGPIGLNPLHTAPAGNVQFADINGDHIADYLIVDVATGAVAAELFNGTSFTDLGQIASGVGSSGSQIHFADLNGDGKADYLDIASNGSVTAWLNGGQASGGGWNWYPQGTIASGVGAPGSQIRFSAIYGSGKADYLVLADNSAVTAWKNGGAASGGGWIWYPQGQVASGVGDPSSQIQFADITGDGRADYLDVGTDGATKAWVNAG